MGSCPRCGKELRYSGESRDDGDTRRYDCSCVCGFEGTEIYELTYVGVTDVNDPNRFYE